MPRFSYVIKSKPDQALQGEIQAHSASEAARKLTAMGYFPLSIREERPVAMPNGVLGIHPAGTRDTLFFTRQLANLIGSGVHLVNALVVLSSQTPSPYMRAFITEVIARIKDGAALSECLASYPGLFSDVYVSMVRSGETSGNLDKVLGDLARLLESEEEFRHSLRAALAYPVFIFAVGILTTVALLVFVIPRLSVLFADMGEVLPLPTRILVTVSGFLRAYWWLFLAGVAALALACSSLGRYAGFNPGLGSFKLKLPLAGTLILKSEVARFSRTLSLLVSSGLPILHALEVAVSVLHNQVLRDEARAFIEQVRNGASLSSCVRKSSIFPLFVANIIGLGEEGGTLEKALLHVADEYEKDTDRALKGISRMVEPVMILTMGVLVGFIVFSMLLPIFQINLLVR